MKFQFKKCSQYILCAILLLSISNSYSASIADAQQIAVGEEGFNGSLVPTKPLILHGQGSSWAATTAISNLPAGISNVTLDAVNCSGSICNAVGSYQNKTIFPLFLTSHDSGASWTFVSQVSGTPSSLSEVDLYGVNCNNGVCVAAGMGMKGQNKFSPVLYVSQNNGASWTYSNAGIADLSDLEGQLSFVVHSANTWIVGGSYNVYYFPYTNYYQTPLLLISKDNGNSWQQLTENAGLPNTDALKSALLTSLDCINGTCFAGTNGSVTNPSNNQAVPLLMQSQDNGQTWSLMNNINNILPADNLKPYVRKVSCTGNVCVTAGSWDWMSPSSPPGGLPFMLRSDDQGASWSFINNIAHLPSHFQGVEINSVSCSNGACVAGGNFGYETNTSGLPMLLTSKDNGLSWSFVQSIANLPVNFTDAYINTVNCSSGVCTAMGYWEDKASTNLPMILTSSDNGVTWSYLQDIALSNVSYGRVEGIS